MTEFEKKVHEKLIAAKKEGEEDIKKKIIEALEEEFLNLTPECIAPGSEVKPLQAETIWISFSRYKGTVKQCKLIFDRKEKTSESYDEVEEFAKEIMKMFPSNNITCHIVNTNEWKKTHTLGARVFGLEFSLDINELIE